MSNELRIDGLAELLEELRRLPAELTGEAGHIVEGTANSAVLGIKQGYPVRAGTLRDRVESERVDSGPFGVGFQVRSKDKLAYIFENGTQARHTSLGANRGSMPAGRVFVPIMIQKRRAMYAELAQMVERHGLKVTGDAQT